MSATVLSGLKPLNLPPIFVETTAAPELLAQMLARTEAAFTVAGRERPHAAVLNAPKFLPDQFATHRDEFFRSGHDVVRNLQAFAARAGVDLAAYRTCFELGCGVGRVTMALAGLFQRVIGADVSAPMLEEAERTAASFDVANITWLLTNRFSIYDEIAEFDVFLSGIALQHNPPPVIGHLLARLLGKLRAGGIAYFQIPTYRDGYAFSVEKYLARPASNATEMHVYPQRALFEVIRRCGCRVLEIREDGSAGQRPRDVSNTLLLEKI